VNLNLIGATITVGEHFTRKIFGMTVNIDTVFTTLAAGVIVIGLGLLVRAKVTSGVPNKLQLAFETIVSGVDNQVSTSMGEAGRPIIPLAVTLFLFILIANWIGLIPSGHNPEYIVAPAADINFTAAMAVFVILLVHATWIRRQGFRRYVSHYFHPLPMFLINIIEEIAKPVTLALRLFGNILAGALLLTLIADLLPAKYIIPIPFLEVIWRAFDNGFVGPLQAFIFALLTILYFQSAISGEH
jgi:F-type H+-transporting ATPase subunit a